MMGADSYFECPNGRMLFAEPFAADGKRYAQMFSLGCFHIFQETLIPHVPKLTRKRLYLAFLRGIDKDGVPISRKCICRTNAELDIARWKRLPAWLLRLPLLDKFGHKRFFFVEER